MRLQASASPHTVRPALAPTSSLGCNSPASRKSARCALLRARCALLRACNTPLPLRTLSARPALVPVLVTILPLSRLRALLWLPPARQAHAGCSRRVPSLPRPPSGSTRSTSGREQALPFWTVALGSSLARRTKHAFQRVARAACACSVAAAWTPRLSLPSACPLSALGLPSAACPPPALRLPSACPPPPALSLSSAYPLPAVHWSSAAPPPPLRLPPLSRPSTISP